MTDPTPPPPAPVRRGGRPAGGKGEERWIETREGGFFFVNALLVFPYVMVLVPLLTRVFVRGVVGGLPRESTIVDTFPLIAEYLLPRMGWLIVLPAALAGWNLRLETRSTPRWALGAFLAAHLAFLGWTVAGWLGLHDGLLPGAAH